MSGLLLVGLIAFVPVVELAKLASAFQILVFSFVNVALIAFRESAVNPYDPSFRAPGYPYVQVVVELALLTQMGTLPILGAVGIAGGGRKAKRWTWRTEAESNGIVGRFQPRYHSRATRP